MQHYIGTKRILAKPMTRKEYNDFRGWQVPADENPDDAGYLVEYLDGGAANTKSYDGYVSWSPKDVFERAYHATEGMTFGEALAGLKLGLKVARHGWNGDGMFVYFVQANSYPAQSKVAKEHFGEEALVPYRAYLALKTTDGDIATWAPSCSDALAEDWRIVP